MDYDSWAKYFERNRSRQQELDAKIRWDVPRTASAAQAAALAASLQRFQLGESGEGKQLIAKSDAAGDVGYSRAIRLFIAEEQSHAALMMKALDFLATPALSKHWSDKAFVMLRRALGLRLELMLFLVAEVVALHYFGALKTGAPEPALRAMAGRILQDEDAHVRFQIQRLREGFEFSAAPTKAVVRCAWWALAIGATTVVAIDHGNAMKVCGLGPVAFFKRALTEFSRATNQVLGGQMLGAQHAAKETQQQLSSGY